MTENTKNTLYTLIGEEKGVHALVDRFYVYMDTLPEAKRVRDVHQEDLSIANDKLFKFFSGWLGGPDLFVREFGHPMLRRRHLPFVIGQSERDEWILCMNKAMAEVDMDEEIKSSVLESLDDLATHMINQ